MKILTEQSLHILLLILSLHSCKANLEYCKPSANLTGSNPPKGQCNTENQSVCCQAGEHYPTYNCSPPVSKFTKAVLTLNSFRKGGDGGGPSECDGKYHNDSSKIVALSTGWYNGGSRCGKKVKISGNGKSVLAKVVDECDSMVGCDAEHDYQPPCANNIVDGSSAVWEALGVGKESWGELNVTWSDA
ncbi:Unknown protein [Striga hermonthica]|uniref:Uncharacterized protein n=1 Tax=Striga hermonthica TaxID=68872 RepID=A0A9N7P039_STRHE|nr:Unknown protein [Striga hermonthica]